MSIDNLRGNAFALKENSVTNDDSILYWFQGKEVKYNIYE